MSAHQQYAAHLAVPVSAHDHAEGPADAATLVEYGDYECPACGGAYEVVAALRERMGDRFRFVFRNFPLTQVHPNAHAAALAAEAAALQGKFWEMHDLLYENQDALDEESLAGYAEALGLDVERFEADRGGRECEERVRRDFLGGARSGVNGTPTFFVNGVRFEGPPDEGSLADALELE